MPTINADTVEVKSIPTAGCIKQNGQLLTLANNALDWLWLPQDIHDVIIPLYQSMSESITANKVFKIKECQLYFLGVQKYSYRINFCLKNLIFEVQGLYLHVCVWGGGQCKCA